MRYTRAGQADIPQLRALWQQAFGDSDAFLDVFFATLFPRCVAFAARDGDTLCAMLYALPQTVLTGKQEAKAAYLYAIATAAACRGRGVCRALMQHAEKQLRSCGVTLLLLAAETPELADMYRRLGYAGSPITFTPQRLPAPAGRAQALSPAEYAGVRETLLMDTPHIRYDKPTLDFVAQDAAYYLLETPQLTGCAAIRRLPGGCLRADECLPDARVLPALSAALGPGEILLPAQSFLFRPLDGQKDFPYAAFPLD